MQLKDLMLTGFAVYFLAAHAVQYPVFIPIAIVLLAWILVKMEPKARIQLGILLLTILSMGIAFSATCLSVTLIATHYNDPIAKHPGDAWVAIIWGAVVGLPSGLAAVAYVAWVASRWNKNMKDKE